MADESSRVLFARLQEGDDQAATEVFNRYVHRLLRLIRSRISPSLQRRVDAEDVLQSALRSFFVRSETDGYILQRAGDLWRLLAAISLSKLRRQVEIHTAGKRAVSKEEYPVFWESIVSSDRDPAPEEQTAFMEELQSLMQAASLSQREALQLRLAGETIEEIAQSMQRSERTIRRLLQSCREMLEERLKAAGAK